MPFRFVRRLYFTYLGFILAVLYFPFVIMGVLSFQGPRGGHTFPAARRQHDLVLEAVPSRTTHQI